MTDELTIEMLRFQDDTNSFFIINDISVIATYVAFNVTFKATVFSIYDAKRSGGKFCN